MAPPQLAPGLLSLPPILHRLSLDPMPSYSKAPRGLFVQSRVARIFTGTSISPSPSLRQRPGRYAFRAGRNLPDKGLRYLRTVHIVTTLYWGGGIEYPLCMSPCRSDHLILVQPRSGVWSLRIPRAEISVGFQPHRNDVFRPHSSPCGSLESP